MSRRLVSLIQETKKLPARFKHVLMALASFANNDGTNIFPSKQAVADRMGAARCTAYRNLDPLVEAGILVKASSHKCKDPDCFGGRHYCGNGHWTQVYNLDVAMLQNATLLREKLCSILLHGQCSKTRKSNVAKCDATPSEETPPSVAETNSSAVTRREGMKEGRNEGASVADAPSASSGSESHTTSEQDTNLYWYLNVCDLDLAFDNHGHVIPHEVRHGMEEDIQDVVALWLGLTGTYDHSPPVMEAIARCFRHHAKYEQLLDYMKVMVKQHPKLSKIPWRDLTTPRGQGFLDKFEYNQRQVDAWRRGMAAKQQAAKV
jgi:Helix-turn-helix domain